MMRYMNRARLPCGKAARLLYGSVTESAAATARESQGSPEGVMEIREEELDLPVDEGTMATFVYRPDDDEPRPAIIMVHDALGLSVDARAQARWIAEQGYVVAAPDTFHRAGRLLTTAALGGGEEATRRIRQGMTNDGHRADMARLAAFLREQPAANGRVGLTGFCLGGRIAYLGATMGGVFDAVVAFYPTRLREPDPAVPGSPSPIDDAGNITRPLLMFFPELDGFNPAEGVEVIRAASENSPGDVEAVWVEGADHGFAQPAGSKHHPQRSAEAWERALSFFAEHLSATPSRAR